MRHNGRRLTLWLRSSSSVERINGALPELQFHLEKIRYRYLRTGMQALLPSDTHHIAVPLSKLSRISAVYLL